MAGTVDTLSASQLNGVALGLLLARSPPRPRGWIEKKLAHAGRGMSGIELHRQIATGVPGKAISNLLLALDITREYLSEFVDQEELNRLEKRACLPMAESDLLYRIARALVYAVSAFGETHSAVRWLKESNEALGGAVPLELLTTVEGDEIVRTEIGAIEQGLPT